MIDSDDTTRDADDRIPEESEPHSKLDAFGVDVVVFWLLAFLCLLAGPDLDRLIRNWSWIVRGPFSFLLRVFDVRLNSLYLILGIDVAVLSLLTILVFATNYGRMPILAHWAFAIIWCSLAFTAY